jgi:hypothetical protein
MELTKVDLSLVDAAMCHPDNRVAGNGWETLMRACTTGLDTAKKDQRLICVATSFESILGSVAGARMTSSKPAAQGVLSLLHYTAETSPPFQEVHP